MPAAAAVAVVAALGAGWLAAGSVGLLGHPLRHVLTWILAGIAIIAALPQRGPKWAGRGAVAVAAAIIFFTTSSIIPAVNIAGLAAAIAILALFADGALARALRLAAASLAVFALFRLAMQASPIIWSWADRLGWLMGAAAGTITGRPLSVGSTFGGVDFIVLSGAFYGLWLASSPAPRSGRAMWGAAGLIAAQLAYLAVLSLTPAMLRDVPEPSKEMPSPQWVIPLPLFADVTLKLDGAMVRQWLPWNVPLLAALLHALVLLAIMRLGSWRRIEPQPAVHRLGPRLGRAAAALVLPALALGLALGMSAVYCTPARSLEGRKIVVYNRVFGNYMKPRHGDYGHLSIGMYGNLKPFIESLGGSCTITNQLTDDELKDCDALLVIYPTRPYASSEVLRPFDPADSAAMFPGEPEQSLRFADRFLHGSIIGAIEDLHIRRVWDYVDRGGTLLVLGEHTVWDPHFSEAAGRNYFNRLLGPSKIRVAFDSATFQIGGWLQSYHTMFHPTTTGIEDSRNQFGVVIGASLQIAHPARPILIGRWGFNDPGDDASGSAMMGNHHYDAGERLGDVVLVAEQPYGRGSVTAFGDTSNMTNGITVGSHAYNSRLLAYLTHSGTREGARRTAAGDSPISTGRQVVTMLFLAALTVLILRSASTARSGWALGRAGRLPLLDAAAAGPVVVLSAMIFLALSLTATSAGVAARAEVYPTEHRVRSAPAKVAYIDNSHLGFYSDESWREEGLMGLSMNLMRSGYLTYLAPDLSEQRLLDEEGRPRASLIIMPAPTQSLTDREIEVLQRWIRAGGRLVMTIGWDRYLPNRRLLTSFGFDIGDESEPGRPPEPLGHFKSPYWQAPDGSYQVFVRFHAGWLVRLRPRGIARDMAYGRNGKPIILARRMGGGQVVLIGDSEFATNKNLENEGGQPIENMRENADFWRWLLSALESPDDPTQWWQPPNPALQAKENAAAGQLPETIAPSSPVPAKDVFDLEPGELSSQGNQP